MQKLIERAQGLVDLALGRRFMPTSPLVESMPRYQIEEFALFNGTDMIANSGPGAIIEPQADSRHLLITTPPQIWAYAAHLMLADVALPLENELLIRVDLWVLQGAVGVGAVDSEGKDLGHDARSVADGRTAVTLRLSAGQRPDQLIVRNVGHSIAQAIVERIQIYQLLADPMAEITKAKGPPISTNSQSLPRAFSLPKPARTMRVSQPLVSIILVVKDGMPYVEEALESVRRQSYRNIEVVVQDCLSTDGTSELIAKFDGAPVRARREMDGGNGDGISRAMKRCKGSLIGSLDSDNLLQPDMVANAVEHFAANPHDAVLYSSVRIISAEGGDQGVHRPGSFDFLRFISCDLGMPWSTTVFNKPVCGAALWIDPDLKTCVDFNTWLRLSHLPITFKDEVQGSTRISANSMTCHPENYDQFCRDKITALRRYVDTCAHEPLRASLMRHGLVGVYCWAAESIKGLDAERTDLVADYYERAKAVDPGSARVALAATRLF